MNDYTWIKPGVEAVVVSAKNYQSLIGKVVTIASAPIWDEKSSTWKVELEESKDIAVQFDSIHNKLFAQPKNLIPNRDVPDWNAIAEGKVANLPSIRREARELC